MKLKLLLLVALSGCTPLHGSLEAAHLAKYGRPAYGADHCFTAAYGVPIYAEFGQADVMINPNCPNRAQVDEALRDGLQMHGLTPLDLNGVVVKIVTDDTRLVCNGELAYACVDDRTIFVRRLWISKLADAVALLPAAKLLGVQVVR